MAAPPTGSSLRELAALAAVDDRAWHVLVAELSESVEDVLARHRVVGTPAEWARSATWRSLARRLHLGVPGDVREWTCDRAAIESQRAAKRWTRQSASGSVRLVERRRDVDRRAVARSRPDRRARAQARTPDTLARELLAVRLE